MDNEAIIKKVQALWAQADHPNTGDAERAVFVAKAQELMAKYQIDEMVLSAKNASQKEDVILSDILIERDTAKGDVSDQRILLAHLIGQANRCRAVIRTFPSSVNLDGSPKVGGTYLTVVGFRSDVDMVRDLYLALGMDMLMAVANEPIKHLTKQQQRDYRANFCDGFAWRVGERLNEINKRVRAIAEEGDGSLLPMLVSRESQVKDFFAEMFPNLSKAKVSKMRHDPAAQARGKQAANNLNLNNNAKLDSAKRAIGSGNG